MSNAPLATLMTEAALFGNIIESNMRLVSDLDDQAEISWIGYQDDSNFTGSILMICELEMSSGPQRAAICIMQDGSHELHVASLIRGEFLPLMVMSIDPVSIDAIRRILSRETSGERLGLAESLLDVILAPAAGIASRTAA